MFNSFPSIRWNFARGSPKRSVMIFNYFLFLSLPILIIHLKVLRKHGLIWLNCNFSSLRNKLSFSFTKALLIHFTKIGLRIFCSCSNSLKIIRPPSDSFCNFLTYVHLLSSFLLVCLLSNDRNGLITFCFINILYFQLNRYRLF